MPRFEPDPSKVSATIEIFDKDDYEFVFGEPKAFYSKNAQTDKETYGIRFPLTIAEGPRKGGRTILTLYQHNDGSASMSKQVVMAVLGYKNSPADEKRFDGETAGQDWSFDTDTGACGEMWRKMSGKRAICSLDIGTNPNSGEPSQTFKKWRPIGM